LSVVWWLVYQPLEKCIFRVNPDVKGCRCDSGEDHHVNERRWKRRRRRHGEKGIDRRIVKRKGRRIIKEDNDMKERNREWQKEKIMRCMRSK
jgi:hypothetical protein